MENIPILGKAHSNIKEFRIEKLKLKELGYPLLESINFVKQYYELIKPQIQNQLTDGCIFLTVPSTSRINKLPILFGNKLANDFKGKLVISDQYVFSGHKGEAKHNLSIQKRSADPVSYGMINEEILKKELGRQKIILVDDVIASGESAIKFRFFLESYGIKISGLVNLRNVDVRYPTKRDLERLTEKLSTKLPLVLKEDIYKSVKIVFSSYVKQKANRVERSIKSDNSALKYWNAIKVAESNERKIIIKPKSKDKGMSM